jgi:phosphate transport system protein
MDDYRKSFHTELDRIRDDIVILAGMVSEAIARGTQILLDGDIAAAEELIANDDVLDALTLDIEERAYRMLALQQPMARDLRALVTALRLTAEIERSGDLMSNVAKAARRLYPAELDPKVRGFVERMGQLAQKLFNLAIDAYVERDAALAGALDDMDDAMDDLHRDFFAALFGPATVDHAAFERAVQLALVGRYYERIGDHAVNIGERVRYMVTGWLPEHTGAARLAARQTAAEAEADA